MRPPGVAYDRNSSLRSAPRNDTRIHVDVVFGPHSCTCVAKERQQLGADDDALRRGMRVDLRHCARRARDVLQIADVLRWWNLRVLTIRIRLMYRARPPS